MAKLESSSAGHGRLELIGLFLLKTEEREREIERKRKRGRETDLFIHSFFLLRFLSIVTFFIVLSWIFSPFSFLSSLFSLPSSSPSSSSSSSFYVFCPSTVSCRQGLTTAPRVEKKFKVSDHCPHLVF